MAVPFPVGDVKIVSPVIVLLCYPFATFRMTNESLILNLYLFWFQVLELGELTRFITT